MFRQYLFDTGCRLGILGNHIQITATASPRQLIPETQVVDEVCQSRYCRWVRPTVEHLVLVPRLPDESSHLLEVIPLDGFVHRHCVLLHLTQQAQFLVVVEEHPPYDFGEDLFGGTGDTRII